MSDKLPQLLAKAKREGWGQRIRTAADERAVLEGCRFDAAAAEHAAEFFHRFLRHVIGRWDGQPFDLLPWQRDEIVEPLYGWKRADGRRRFRYASIWVPKKNGKSGLSSGLALYALTADNEPRAEVYAVATEKKQAGIVFNVSAAMVKKSPPLARRCKIIDSTKRITFRDSWYEVLSGEDASSEGKNAQMVVTDELHAWNTPKLRRLFAALYYAGISRENPLLITISTSGEDNEDELWYEEHGRAAEILSGDSTDTQRLAVIYEATAADVQGDNWTKPEVHKRCNPSYGETIDPEEMLRSAEEAAKSARLKAMFLRYRLNRPQSLKVKWLEPGLWDACAAAPDFPLGCDCFGGLDLSSSDDLTALVLVRRQFGDDADQDDYDVKPWIFIPEETLKRQLAEGKYTYKTWADKGLLVVTPGNTIDHRYIERTIVEAAETYRIQQIGFDPWSAEETATILLNEHAIQMAPMRQGAATLSEPMKKVERLVRSKRIRHGGHQVLAWMADNTVAKSDPNQNIRPIKPEPKSPQKIDGIVALIMAVGRAMLTAAPSNPYARRGPIYASLEDEPEHEPQDEDPDETLDT